MRARQLPLTLAHLVGEFSQFELYHCDAYVDAESGEVFCLSQDVVDYCRGNREGTDLQLSDSHELPRAQAVAEEAMWLERGFDEEGLPFTDVERRFFQLPRLGELDSKELEERVQQWLEEHSLDTQG